MQSTNLKLNFFHLFIAKMLEDPTISHRAPFLLSLHLSVVLSETPSITTVEASLLRDPSLMNTG